MRKNGLHVDIFSWLKFHKSNVLDRRDGHGFALIQIGHPTNPEIDHAQSYNKSCRRTACSTASDLCQT